MTSGLQILRLHLVTICRSDETRQVTRHAPRQPLTRTLRLNQFRGLRCYTANHQYAATIHSTVARCPELQNTQAGWAGGHVPVTGLLSQQRCDGSRSSGAFPHSGSIQQHYYSSIIITIIIIISISHTQPAALLQQHYHYHHYHFQHLPHSGSIKQHYYASIIITILIIISISRT